MILGLRSRFNRRFKSWTRGAKLITRGAPALCRHRRQMLFCLPKGQRLAGVRRPGELGDPVQRASIKCQPEGPTVFDPCPPLSPLAGWVTDARSPGAVPLKGSRCIAPLHLRRHDRCAAVRHQDRPLSMRRTSSALGPCVALNQRPLAWLKSRRLTWRCSEPHHYKVLGRGRRAESAHERWRARVLKRRRAVAELSS